MESSGIDQLYILPNTVDLGVVWFFPIVISSTVFRGPERLVALEFGLDFFSCDRQESFASSMIFVVTLLVMIGVWPWMWGVLDRKVFYGEGSTLTMLS